MVPIELLKRAIDQLPKWNPNTTSRLTWVNWRQGFQIKMSWYGQASLVCFLDFKKNVQARDAVLKQIFSKHADPGKKPVTIAGHGWTALDHSLRSNEFISVNEVAEIAESMGFEFTVLYVQECSAARPAFDTMGIPLVPGEMGKEWVEGTFVPYSCPSGQCL